MLLVLHRPLDGFYRGTRFDRSGVFASLRFDGMELCGEWFQQYDPYMHDAVRGPVDEFSMIPVGIFSITYILNIYFQLVPFDGVYDYYYFSDIFSYGTLIIPLALIVLSLGISILLYLLNRGLGKLFFKEEPSSFIYNDNDNHDDDDDDNDDNHDNDYSNLAFNTSVDNSSREQELEGSKNESLYNQEAEEEKVTEDAPQYIEESDEEESTLNPEEPKPVKKPTTKKTSKKPATSKKVTKESTTTTNGTKVYHLTKRKEDGMWAITFVGGKKPVKLFKTKKEAEEYLATLTKNQGATALIRNSKGAKAGKFASSIKSDEDKK